MQSTKQIKYTKNSFRTTENCKLMMLFRDMFPTFLGTLHGLLRPQYPIVRVWQPFRK